MKGYMFLHPYEWVRRTLHDRSDDGLGNFVSFVPAAVVSGEAGGTSVAPPAAAAADLQEWYTEPDGKVVVVTEVRGQGLKV